MLKKYLYNEIYSFITLRWFIWNPTLARWYGISIIVVNILAVVHRFHTFFSDDSNVSLPKYEGLSLTN